MRLVHDASGQDAVSCRAPVIDANVVAGATTGVLTTP